MGIANEMNNEVKNKIKKDDFKEYVYVMVSTLNQMVNYIPLKHFEFKEVYNITIDDSEYADNSKWDKNIKQFIEVNEDIVFKQNELSDITIIKNRLEKKFKDKNVFWNITGGQRPFILAINQIAKDNDVICYLEGNKNQMILLKNNKELKGIVDDYSLNDLKDLNIEIALKLMGFDIKDSSNNSNIDHIDSQKMKNFIEVYKTNKDLVKLLIDTKNVNKSKTIEELNNINIETQIKENIQEVIEWGYQKNKSTPFGYILEEMLYYLISNSEFSKNILELKTNVRIYKDEITKQIDEFDIALLTKNGKFMIFECKSGNMKGDVAKSTKYSTYAVSGVYGLPILITPLLKDEIHNIDSLDKEVYGYIQSAVKSAKRAGLEVWGLDEIEEKLKKYLD